MPRKIHKNNKQDMTVALPDASTLALLTQCDSILNSSVRMMTELENQLLFDTTSSQQQLRMVRFLRSALSYLLQVERRTSAGDNMAVPEMMDHVQSMVHRTVGFRLPWLDADPPTAASANRPPGWSVKKRVAMWGGGALILRFLAGMSWFYTSAALLLFWLSKKVGTAIIGRLSR
jgi:hypothetical protein